MRKSAANVIRSVGKRAEDVLDQTSERVSDAAQTGQDAIRSSRLNR
jgi:phage-related protein